MTASGALTSVNSQNLGFRTGDRLKEVDVKVGDPVRPGQVLAKIDDLRTRAALGQAQGALDAAQANLQLALDGVQVPNAVALRDQASRSFERTKASVGAQIAAARNNLRQADVKADYDLRDLRTKNIRARASGCDTSRSDESNFTDTSRDPNPITTLPPGMTTGTTTGTATGTTPAAAGSAASGGMDATGGMGNGSAMTPTTSGATGTASTASATSAPTCVVADQTAAVAAFATALASRTADIAAQKALDVAIGGAQVAIEGARTALITAQTNLATASVTRPNTIDQLKGAVRAAEAALSTAQGNLADTVLYAPVGGVVSAINGAIGEFVATGSGTTAQSPGNAAPIPGVGAAASSDQAGSAASGISATRPGGAAFLQLNNINGFEVVVPFEESDGTRVKPNQQVNVTFDSLPGVSVPGTVLSVAPNGVNISGVTNYYATVVLSRSDPGLRPGLTSQAAVVVNHLDNVVTVPNAAVFKRDGRSFVHVLGPNGQPADREFQPGATGDLSTEVISGLDAGQSVLPSGGPAPAGTGINAPH